MVLLYTVNYAFHTQVHLITFIPSLSIIFALVLVCKLRKKLGHQVMQCVHKIWFYTKYAVFEKPMRPKQLVVLELK